MAHTDKLRVHVDLPKDLADELDREARAMGLNRTALLVVVLRQRYGTPPPDPTRQLALQVAPEPESDAGRRRRR